MEPLQHYPNVQIISTIVKGLATASDEFSEKFQKAFDPPPPSFLEFILQNFYDKYGCIYARRYDGQIV